MSDSRAPPGYKRPHASRAPKAPCATVPKRFEEMCQAPEAFICPRSPQRLVRGTAL
eukprot:CAMPEP_0171972060 /NCGR_PEP_ID=MMETSP0993-20121228/220889_2 /TAXON_ID=483369 /ORGANISM="non described non described, Strain CCMP2098" /LENGTH=55 /DNA_ID=CAMNT_0012622525 /DNA_START=556 /DNA_END=723 /DNA_ORIENTATION=-